jgi:hypothetical protein
MNFHDEIVKLQAQNAALTERVAALEVKAIDPESAPSEPVAITDEYLESLTAEELGELYKAKRISEATLGLWVMRKVFPQGAPAELQNDAKPVAVSLPEPVNQDQIDRQNAHDRETGNLNEAGHTPYEAVEAEAAAVEAADTHAEEIEDAENNHGQGEAAVETEDAGLES